MAERAYPVRIVRDVLIPMRDGIHLAGNLYLPEGAGPVPGILEYTPYLKDGHGGRGRVETAHLFFARRGYACLTLDMRGFGASEGVAAPPFSASEKSDGQAALAWMAAQPWCSGETAIWGVSYGGDTALSVASTLPPSLKAIVPVHATDDEFSGLCYPHGCRQALWGEIDWGLRMLGLQLLPPLRFGSDRRWARLWHERLERVEPWPFTWHTISPSTWASWRVDVEAIRAATYAVSAWHDCYPLETLRYYNAISAPKRALIGPWKHEHPDHAVTHRIGFLHEMGRWWDHWLKGIDTGIMDEPPVVVYHQPGGGWRAEDSWPPRATSRDYLLQPRAELAPSAPAQPGCDTYRVDPTVGLARLPWDWTTPTSPTPLDVSPDDHRALTYTTAPLDADLDIAGNPDVILHLSADQPDFPLAAWLSDVAPSGFSTLICQGWARPAHLAGQRLETDHVYELRVMLHPTAYCVNAGHRLRLAVAGSLFPLLIPASSNPRLTIHRSSERPSRLRLPVAGPPERTYVFQPPHDEPPEALLLNRADHVISRDLLGRTAEHRQQRRAVYRLEGGVIFRMDLDTRAAIDAHCPGEVSLQGTWTLTVERPVNAVVVRAEAIETLDHLHLAARITLDGRPFYRRAWDLDLRQAAWSLKT